MCSIFQIAKSASKALRAKRWEPSVVGLLDESIWAAVGDGALIRPAIVADARRPRPVRGVDLLAMAHHRGPGPVILPADEAAQPVDGNLLNRKGGCRPLGAAVAFDPVGRQYGQPAARPPAATSPLPMDLDRLTTRRSWGWAVAGNNSGRQRKRRAARLVENPATIRKCRRQLSRCYRKSWCQSPSPNRPRYR